MGYKVIGAAAVVEFNTGSGNNPDVLNTGTKVYVDQNAPLPEGVKEACIEHLLTVGLIEETDGPTESGRLERPAASASKGKWLAFAEQEAEGDEEKLAALDAMTRDEIAAAYAEPTAV